MAAGFIYFASTLPGLVKVGRFARHLTVADKERQYRTLVPGFTIHHAYLVKDDVVAEEARILAHLRLVAGTTVTGAGRENFNLPMDVALKAAGTSVAELEEQARATIRAMKPGLEGLTVEEIIAEINHNRGGVTMPMAPALRRNSTLGRALRSVGLHASPALPEQELDVHVYGVVLDSGALLKACPALKPCATVLDTLTL
ncbi:hypothetical protein AB4Y45_34795 [Paraburkholderia sp. EG287A]|uniref:hypothetical protein n=1 Tax=Paraburkholderia sp. EG287A TaxID=3237012 RepID=UPI0034D33433